MKVRRHLARAAKRPGLARKRWSRRWIYYKLGLCCAYGVRYITPVSKALPATIRHIALGVKWAGEPGALIGHAGFEEAEVGIRLAQSSRRGPQAIVGDGQDRKASVRG